jgi:hypothetical protein
VEDRASVAVVAAARIPQPVKSPYRSSVRLFVPEPLLAADEDDEESDELEYDDEDDEEPEE